MNLETPLTFPELEDGDLDIAAIFRRPGAAAAVPPPAPGTRKRTEKTEDTVLAAEPAAQKKPAPAQSAEQESPAVEKPMRMRAASRICLRPLRPKTSRRPSPPNPHRMPPSRCPFDKPPIFSYGGVKAEIADASMTFEELRIEKGGRFPGTGRGQEGVLDGDLRQGDQAHFRPQGHHHRRHQGRRSRSPRHSWMG